MGNQKLTRFFKNIDLTGFLVVAIITKNCYKIFGVNLNINQLIERTKK